MQAYDFIPADNFDREYGLADLLPTPLIAGLLAPLGKLAAVTVVKPDGSVHYGDAAIAPERLKSLFEADIEQSKTVFFLTTDSSKVAACPLLHEMDQIGLLLIQANTKHANRLLPAMAHFLAAAMSHMMHTTYQNKLAFGLHAQVVVESYEQLEKKAAQIQVSEAKYRSLAENLEVEVQRKTDEIRKTQLMLMQREKMASIGQLAAGVAHEINNPIGFLISNLNTLSNCFDGMAALIRDYERLSVQLQSSSKGVHLNRNTQQVLADIERTRQEVDIDYILEDGAALIGESLDGGQRVQTIVRNLREFTHPSVKKAEMVDINGCLDTTLSVLENLIPDNVFITKAYQPIPGIICHLREINQAFYHILHNAILAVGNQGSIEIRTQTNGPLAEIAVKDTGQGIGEDEQLRIFDPFFTTRDVGQGTGLGLHTAYHIVQKHGGTIGVDSCVGHGSTFTIRLPLEPPQHIEQNTKGKN